MSTSSLTVLFTGVCAFADTYRRVIMPHASTGGTSVFVDKSIPPHYPYVRFLLSDLNLTAGVKPFWIVHEWKPPLQFGVGTDPVMTGVFFPQYYQIKLPVALDDPVNDPTPRKGPLPSGDQDSLDWIVKMSELAPSAALKAGVNSDTPGADVAAFVKLPNGRLSTSFAPPVKFRGVKRDGTVGTNPVHSFAQLVKLSMLKVLGDIEIKFVPHFVEGDEAPMPFSLPLVSKTGVAVRIVIGHSAIEDVLQLAARDSGLHPDYHFELLYRIMKPMSAAEVVLPLAEELPGKEVSFPRCVPTAV